LKRRSEARCDLIFKAFGVESRSKMKEAKGRANTAQSVNQAAITKQLQ
jgi:hypothetical protein